MPKGSSLVDGQVGPQDLGIGEVLVDQVDLAGADRRRPSGWFSGSATKAKVGLLDVEAGELHAGVGELVGDPDVGGAAGEDADAAADLGLLVVEDVPVEADAGREQQVARGHLVGLDAVDSARPWGWRSGMSLMIGTSRRSAQGQGEVGQDRPLVADVAAELRDAELGPPLLRGVGGDRSRGNSARRCRSRSCRGSRIPSSRRGCGCRGWRT